MVSFLQVDVRHPQLRAITLTALCLLLLAACAPAPSAAPTAVPTLPSSPTPLPPTATAAHTPTPEPTAVPAPTFTPTPFVCSPLAGYALDQLPGLVSNPYTAPPPGSDMPHEGVDLADLLPGANIARPGMTVQAALPGAVAAVLDDRFPYGSAVIIETRLSDLPPGYLAALTLPMPLDAPLTNPSLTCPAYEIPLAAPAGERSLYLVYAHLQSAPQLQPGQAVGCGQPLGAVGDSGNALVPHLHFEARIGPAGARFASLAHYDNSATSAEMAAYCLWRVSGVFLIFDPLTLLHR